MGSPFTIVGKNSRNIATKKTTDKALINAFALNLPRLTIAKRSANIKFSVTIPSKKGLYFIFNTLIVSLNKALFQASSNKSRQYQKIVKYGINHCILFLHVSLYRTVNYS